MNKNKIVSHTVITGNAGLHKTLEHGSVEYNKKDVRHHTAYDTYLLKIQDSMENGSCFMQLFSIT